MRDEDWDDYVQIVCPECRQPVGVKCRNPISGREARTPCLKRMLAAGRATA